MLVSFPIMIILNACVIPNNDYIEVNPTVFKPRQLNSRKFIIMIFKQSLAIKKVST